MRKRTNNEEIRFRMKWMIGFLALTPLALSVRLYYVQVLDHDYYLRRARETYTSRKSTKGKRGEIFDCNGHLLVSNAPCVHIIADPSHLKNEAARRKLAYILARHLEGSYQEYLHQLRPYRQRIGKDGRGLLKPDGTPDLYQSKYAVIERNVDLETADRIREQARFNRIRALSFNDDYKRSYPKGSMLSNVIGYTNVVDDRTVPQGGLEKRLNTEMTAGVGSEVFERTRGGVPLNYGMHEISECRDGKNVYLTISEPIQAILEEGLDAAFAKWNPQTIYAAIVDPRTGNILAMAQRPTFNPNIRSTFRPEAARTRIAEDAIEPGSIIKPFSIGKALDWGIVTPSTIVDCSPGYWMYLNKKLTDTHNYGKLDMAGVIQKSSNIGTAKVALLMGKEKVYQTFRLFGFGSRTGLPFPLENRGVVRPPERWDGLSITRMPIGYSIQVTPLQMLRAYSALANGGLRPELRLIDRIEDPATGTVLKMPVVPPQQMFENPEAHKQLIGMMIRVCQPGGTAAKASIPGYEVAGKTGTSRKYIPGKGYAPGKYFSSFIGFVPARSPAFVMLVTVDEPKGAYYASTVAVPTFREVSQKVLQLMNIPPDPVLMPEPKKKK